MTPVPVAPQQRGLEPLDQLADLRAHERVDVALRIGIVGVAPVEQRVVAAEHGDRARRTASASSATTSRLGPSSHRVAVGVRGVPPAEAVVVLGDVHEVPHARVVEELRVPVGVEALEGQLGDEVVERLRRRSAPGATPRLRAAGTSGAARCRAWSRGSAQYQSAYSCTGANAGTVAMLACTNMP